MQAERGGFKRHGQRVTAHIRDVRVLQKRREFDDTLEHLCGQVETHDVGSMPRHAPGEVAGSARQIENQAVS